MNYKNSGRVLLVKFSYWFKFQVNISTGSRVTTIFVYKGLTRNPEIGNTPVWVLPNIYRLNWVSDTKFGTNVSNEKLLNATKFGGYSFYCFWVIKGTPTRGGGGVVIKILIIQIKVKGVHCDSFETFFVIPETYQLLVLNLRWSS